MNRSAALAVSPAPLARMPLMLQRKCACSKQSPGGSPCETCAELQRKAAFGSEPETVPPIVHDVLRSPGQPLGAGTRGAMEKHFGHDFSSVRVHADRQASASAQAVNALAYTVGRDTAFASGQYDPASAGGRRLIAHELAHVVQQNTQPAGGAGLTIGASGGAPEREADSAAASFDAGRAIAEPLSPAAGPMLSRASPDATGYVMRLGTAARSGLQFTPRNVTDTRVGPVGVEGGLLSRSISRLSVIISENQTPLRLARELLPLWLTATPATPAGAAAPLPVAVITAEQLARGLMVYNRFYIPVPSMANWKSGFRLPLPVQIDEATGVATLHPGQILDLASGFDEAWAPQLDKRAATTAAAPAATLQADVKAFLARETTALARGVALAARSLTNASVEQPFVLETLKQLGVGDRFDVALAFMDHVMTKYTVTALADQLDGFVILSEIEEAIAHPPAVLTASQQAAVTRANAMLATIPFGAVDNPPAAARDKPEKEIVVDTVKLEGSTHNTATDIAVADAIYSQCNVRVKQGANPPVTDVQSRKWLKGNSDLRSASNCNAPSPEELALFRDATSELNLTSRFQAYFAATGSGISASGWSCNPSDGMAPSFRNRVVILNSGDTATLAHELGHVLIDIGHTKTGLMSSRPPRPAMRSPEITDPHCERLYKHV